MPFLQNPFRVLQRLWAPRPKAHAQGQAVKNPSIAATGKRSASDAFLSATTRDGSVSRKKRKTQADHVGFEEGVESDKLSASDGNDSPDITRNGFTCASKPDNDRNLMPPPLVSFGHNRRTSLHKAPRTSIEHAETASQATRSTRIARSELLDEYDMEEARRKAAATQLPPNSGIWDTGERELFFHLSYRGFEPLLPKNWMIDFPTLPLSVFAHQETDIPLIQCHRSTQFRAIRALRELLDTGTAVRDRTASSRDLRTEPTLEKATTKFLLWALKDMGYPQKPSKTTIPVHTIATLLPGQSTQEAIRKLASEMHILAAKHREAVNVRPSVEQQDLEALTPPYSDGGPTQIHGNVTEEERPLPVIYGIMIASSILAVFTLNSHIPFPPFLVRALVRNQQNMLTPEKAAAINPHLPAQIQSLNEKEIGSKLAQRDEDSGVRFIANFDLSDSSADVWNALVIAILAMQIRKTMGEVFETWQQIKSQTLANPTKSSSINDEDDDEDEDQDEVRNEFSIDRSNSGLATSPNPIAFEDSWLSNFEEGDEDVVDQPSVYQDSNGGPVSSSPLRGKSRSRSKSKSKISSRHKGKSAKKSPVQSDPDA